MTTATIFIKDIAWLSDEPCVGVRFDTQSLPTGVWVAAFITRETEAVDKPYFKMPRDERMFREAITYARAVVRGEYMDEPDGLL